MLPQTTSNCKMLSTQKYVISTNIFSCPSVKVKKNINGETRTIVSMAKKDDFSQKSTPKTPLKIVSQAVVAVLGLGFIDAGYSGDWSRIGVISKENEDFLKVAALVVVPLCLFIIFSISKTADD
ncbi:hypothetical protein HanPI659440_Chr03g0099981 [Helianthus annuus]|uniref:DUF7887 domain-containing protein n=1 Tax=Helianthus annuus TaxID=4232 RepID=A0A251V575_HELAN|nr:uncharacterized protein LOC110928910 [Helianthus annuus]KAF5813078.1 hypothetical protein HanXRQr2_Chr03g0094041 [Helianthus annuus]KAJ0591892.1 hypothetical protein HanHA300_Chr03g0078571 [Helianthus annuus]KAJ0606868.1 hypothetical protein HanHA89_Chr03g0089991 [Helianthus annuus]KAJ0766927.1 hypothetical protein HanLR1_Chr03g0083221 [Helianthus annuus]KAJ0800176.1 hypothetical protein HanPI659440_Chr03g0099981 [Helianthus annuus]